MNKNYVFSDKKKVHVVTHQTFDEAHMLLHVETLPPLTQALQRAGCNNAHTISYDTILTPDSSHIKVQLLTQHAKELIRATLTSARLDLYCPNKVVVEPHSTTLVATDIAIEPMPGTYAQVSTTGSFTQQGISTLGGVIDPNYRGNITIVLYNPTKIPFYIEQNTCFVHLIMKQIWTPSIQVVPSLNHTEYSVSDSGNTTTYTIDKTSTNIMPSQPVLLDNFPILTSEAAATMSVEENPIVTFTSNSFENGLLLTIVNTGGHPTRGLDVTFCEQLSRVKLIACNKGTPV